MLATDSHSVKRSEDAHSREKTGQNRINSRDYPVIVHGSVSSKQASDNKPQKRKRNPEISRHSSRGSGPPFVPERRGFNRGGPQYNALRDKNWLSRLYGLTDLNVAQLPEQSRHTFSIPTADVEEPTAVLSGSGISINQRAHLRDINSCMSALLCASNIGLNRAMERLVLERDRVLLNLEESSSVPGEMTVLEIQDSMAESL
ncbi:hypothetical protein V496_00053 [Pseudogymnoascus sp. VKM F-4515 (FW-2607)]|nr:hypothetical protein V496_00053 [Pseudogymnoascus sp. VKM F-4515 (FW-2607)]